MQTKYYLIRCLHWLRITERIEYKLLSLTYKVLATTQSLNLHNLIYVQPPRSTCSSSLVSLLDHQHHPQCVQLVALLGMLHPVSGINFLVLSVNLIPVYLSVSYMHVHAFTTSSHSVSSPLSLSITPSVIHCRLNTYLFHKPFPP